MKATSPIFLLLCFWALGLPAADCNLNGVDDATDIDLGQSADCNSNALPDECERARLRFGSVGDAIALPESPRASTAADLNGDGVDDAIVAGDAADDASILSVFLASGGGSFEPALRYDAGTRLSEVVAVDFDGDGDQDLVTVNWTALLLFANRGDGTLEPSTELAVPRGTRHITVADLNGDDRPDLVTASPTGDTITWFLGTASGTFGSSRTIAVLDRPVGIAAGDFDSDTDVDLAVAGATPEALLILENQGGSFSEGPLLQAARMTSVAAGDLDGDGDVDLVGGTWNGTFVWSGDGQGGFSEPQVYEFSAAAVRLVDIDRDTRLDLVVAGFDQADVTVFRGSDDGSLQLPQGYGVEFEAVSLGDFDADGDLDLAAAGAGPDRLLVLLQGEVDELVLERFRHDAAGRPHGIAAGDFTGDGFPDVITAHSVDSTSSLFIGTGDGGFREEPLTFEHNPWSPSVAVADLDEDGIGDIVHRVGGALEVRLSLGGGDFQEKVSYESVGFQQFLTKADLDGDGHMDMLGPTGDAVTVNYGDGQGGLAETESIPLGGRRSWEVEAGDLDGDGRNDLVAANGNSSDISIVLQTATRVFAPPILIPLVGSPHGVALGDFNRDGRLDIASANERTADVSILLNRGDSNFEEAVRVPLNRGPYSIIAVDVDGDGLKDLAATSEGQQSLSIVRSRGDGTFTTVQQFGTGSGSRFTVAPDLDQDGDFDLVVADRRARGITVFVNQFEAPAARADFLPMVCTELDFEEVSSPAPRSASHAGALRDTRFLLPAGDGDTVGSVFVNTSRFARDDEFLRAVFPERFGELSAEGYDALVKRRATREYFAGSVSRLRVEGSGIFFGFDVVTESEAGELLAQAELEAIFEELGQLFSLRPLVYTPRTAGARDLAASFNDPSFEVVPIDDEPPPPPPPPVGTPTFELEIPPETELCGVFAVAGNDRGLREEYELKSVVRLRAGVIELPTVEETFPGELFEEVLFGPDRQRARANGPGEFRLRSIPGEVATFRFTYLQEFALSDGRRLELEVVVPLSYEARGDDPIEKRRGLSDEFFIALKGREALAGRLDGEPVLSYGSCGYESLQRWSVAWELADGAQVLLEERYEEAASLFDTAPAVVVRAEIHVGEVTRVVSDYEKLVYSAFRHNTEVGYWVVVSPPLALEGVGEVHAIELLAPEAERDREASAAYLGADFVVLKAVGVAHFTRDPLVEPEFVRGDTSGDGEFDVLDAITLLGHIFRRETVGCSKAGDTNDDGRLNLLDAIMIVSGLFGRGDLPVAPFPGCGQDPTADTLTCSEAPPCVSGP